MTANVGTYDNILPTGLANLVIQNIVGTPTAYNVYDGNGVLVASGAWPTVVPPAFVGGSDNSVTVNGTTSVSLTPKSTGGATPVIGTVLVVTTGEDSSGGSQLTVSGGHVTTWKSPSGTSGQHVPGIYYGVVTTAGAAAITVTANSGQEVTATVTVWANVDNVSAADQTGTHPTAQGSAVQAPGPTFTTVGNGEVIIGAVNGDATITTPYGTPLFTEFSAGGFKSGSNGNYSAGYFLQTSAGALGTWGWGISGGNSSAFTWVTAVSLSPAVGGTTLSIPAPSGTWKPGYYYVDLVTGTSHTGVGFSVDSIQVQIWRDLGNLPSPSSLPALGTNPADGVPNNEGEDLYLHGLLAHGPERYSITTTAAPTTDTGAVGGLGRTIAGIQAGIAAEKSTTLYLASGQVDPARPRPQIVNFPADSTTTVGGSVAPSTYAAGVTSVVTALGPGTTTGVIYFEGINEPNLVLSSVADSATLFNQFRTAVRAGSTSAKAVGPANSCAAPNNADGNLVPELSQVTAFLTDVASGGGAVDAISVHNYNGWKADPLVVETWLSDLRTVMTTAGIGSAPIFCTEMGDIYKGPIWSGSYNILMTDRRLVAAHAASFLGAERNGVPKEYLLYFYDTFQGGQEVYSGLKDTDGSLGTQATFLRVYDEEVWGKAWTRSLSFGTTGDLFYRADVFSEGSSGSGTGAMVAVWAPGMVSETVTLSNVGSSTVVASDWLGNTTNYTPSGGVITLTITDMPTYVRIPLAQAASVAVSAVGGGIGSSTNLASSATAKAGSNPASLTTTALLNDGTIQTGGYLSGPDYNYTSSTVPQYAELDWGSSKTLNHVFIRQAAPWSNFPNGGGGASAMLTGKLEYWNGSAWVGCPTVAGSHWDSSGNYSNTTANEFQTTIGHNDQVIFGTQFYAVYSQWDQNWVNHVVLSSPVTTTKIRLTVSTVSNTNFVDMSIEANTTPTVSLSEIEAFFVPSAITATPGIAEVVTGKPSVVASFSLASPSTRSEVLPGRPTVTASLSLASPSTRYEVLAGRPTVGISARGASMASGYARYGYSLSPYAGSAAPFSATTGKTLAEFIPGKPTVAVTAFVTITVTKTPIEFVNGKPSVSVSANLSVASTSTLLEVVPGTPGITVPAGVTGVGSRIEAIPGSATFGIGVNVQDKATLTEVVVGKPSTTVPTGGTAGRAITEVVPGTPSFGVSVTVASIGSRTEFLPGTPKVGAAVTAQATSAPVEVIPGTPSTTVPTGLTAVGSRTEVIPGSTTVRVSAVINVTTVGGITEVVFGTPTVTAPQNTTVLSTGTQIEVVLGEVAVIIGSQPGSVGISISNRYRVGIGVSQ